MKRHSDHLSDKLQNLKCWELNTCHGNDIELTKSHGRVRKKSIWSGKLCMLTLYLVDCCQLPFASCVKDFAVYQIVLVEEYTLTFRHIVC